MDLALQSSLGVVRDARVTPDSGEAMRRVIEALVRGGSRERAAAWIALEAFVDARLRSRVAADAEREAIVSDVIAKVLARPELFLAATNPAAYVSVAAARRFLSNLRADRRREARERRVDSEARAATADVLHEAETRLTWARAQAGLRRAAEEAINATHGEELQRQRTEAWEELCLLHEGAISMDEVIVKHISRDPELAAQAGSSLDSARHRARARVLQRHHRLRKLVLATIERMSADPTSREWSPARGVEVRDALQRFLVRCHKQTRNAHSPSTGKWTT